MDHDFGNKLVTPNTPDKTSNTS